MKKTLAAVVLVALASLSVDAEVLEQVLVKVNGDIITKTELETRQVAAIRQRNRTNVSTDDLRNDAELKKLLDEITPQLVVDAVDELLVMQRGKELGYRMGDEQFSQILTNIRKENKLEDDAAFEAALKQEGLTLPELRKSLERNMIMSRVQQVEVFGRIAITEDESRTYYNAHPTEFSTPSSITIREITVDVPTEVRGEGTSAQPTFNALLDDAAKAKAESLRKRALAGEDFVALVTEASDSASKANGGLIGPLNSDELNPQIKAILDGLKVGGVSEPLRTQRGYQLLKLETRSETKTLSFEEARDQIANKVFATKRQGEVEKYLKRLRAQAIIEWRNDAIKAMFDARTAS
ncbi:MAG: peptidylprolyl isomerase [Acidobacteria bacterium]|nr:peptidylprolyl isomerase [Acidobacteriota bacterium]